MSLVTRGMGKNSRLITKGFGGILVILDGIYRKVLSFRLQLTGRYF